MDQSTIFITLAAIAVAYFITGSILLMIEDADHELTGCVDVALVGTDFILKLALLGGVVGAVLWWSAGILAGALS